MTPGGQTKLTHAVQVSDGMRRQQWSSLQCAGEPPDSPQEGSASLSAPDQVQLSTSQGRSHLHHGAAHTAADT